MKKLKAPWILGLAAAMLAACDKETRDGQLTLAGSSPIRIVDESGKTVEFPAGPTRVEFSAGSSRKFTVTVSQGDSRKARFSGQAPAVRDGWNFSLRGKDIGQPADLSSSRTVEYTGQPWRQIGRGGSCGMGGTWVTDDTYQSCNEDWGVEFADAATGASLGAFRSRRDNQTCLISSHNVFCEGERRDPVPPYPRHDFSKTGESLRNIADTGVRFD